VDAGPWTATLGGLQAFPVRAGFGAISPADGGAPSFVRVSLSDSVAACGGFASTSPGPGGNQVVATVSGAGLTPNVYPINLGATGVTATVQATFVAPDGGGLDMQATAGSVTLSVLSSTQVAGSFDVNLALGDGGAPSELTGTFTFFNCE
jgi:hypothetical protein